MKKLFFNRIRGQRHAFATGTFAAHKPAFTISDENNLVCSCHPELVSGSYKRTRIANNRQHKKSAFTLAELLTAILIISPVTNLIGDTLTDFTNPSEGTPSFQVDFEPETQLIHVNCAPIRQDYLSYHVSYRTALVTLFSMSIISITAVILAFRKIQKSMHLVSSGRRHLFSRKHSTQIFHTRSMYSVHRAVLPQSAFSGRRKLAYKLQTGSRYTLIFG